MILEGLQSGVGKDGWLDGEDLGCAKTVSCNIMQTMCSKVEVEVQAARGLQGNTEAW